MVFYLGLSFIPNNAGAPNALHRIQTDEGRRILALLDRKAGGSSENPAGTVFREDGGRPFFADGHADFSISHSGRLVAVAYAGARERDRKVLRIGCDVQMVDTQGAREGIVRRFFHDEERRYVEAARTSWERSLRFFKLWVLKEAYLKMKGFSIGDIAKTPVFFPEGEKPSFRTTEPLNFYLSPLSEPPDQYMLAVCGDALGPPETLWFSRSLWDLE
jgi:phosphopantetheinyl transferase